MKLNRKLASALLFILAMCVHAENDEKLTDLNDQTEVAVTIYNENLALIKDARKISLDNGMNKLAFRGVSALMRPETALLRNLNGAQDIQIIEQNFDFDLLTPQKLLEKYVGKEIQIANVNPATGIETQQTATVLSTNQGVVVKIDDRIETNPTGRYIFDQVPKNLRDKPTLVLQLNNLGNTQQDVELSYLSGGLSWQADYVAELNATDEEIDLMGWVTLNNNSGTSYNNAKMQLVAGDVNQVQEEFSRSRKAVLRNELAVADIAEPLQQESLFEYHLYTLNRPTSILDKQTKQVSLLTANRVPVNKEFLLQGNDYYYRSRFGDIGQKLKVGVFVEFKNNETSGLGMPLPKGVVRVYKKDTKGNAQFIGEDRIDHTPKNEDIKLKLGDAFDVTADKKQASFKKRSGNSKYNYVFESSYEIELKNAKSEDVEVIVREPVPGDWKMLASSHEHRKVASGTAEWKVKVPAEGKLAMTYTVLVRF